ncbi:hypothetical protein HID58_034758 [Brassica napus]|uniref:F-box associated beta-propeller type 3 domain-containing protein n=1 Tax=Brassica napus TaxID=3708 RepID=A0ABQ8C3U9_BRANA|nr:hypothetical protein HID58_034758 [Brassica napus]
MGINIVDLRQLKDLFLTNSSLSHPRLIFAIKENGVWSIFSLSQHLTPYEKHSSSLVVTPEFHMKFPPDDMWIFRSDNRQFACGYICLWFDLFLRYRRSYSFFGFDPVEKQYKVLHMAYPYGPNDHRVMTLGTRGMRWRKIHCSLRLENLSEGVCINGVLYYLGDTSECKEKIREKSSFAIACFDIRVINLFPHYASVVGVISTGEIVLSMADYTCTQPLNVELMSHSHY